MSDNLPKSPEQKTLRQEDEKSSSWWHISDSLLARMYQFINLIFPVHQEEPKPAIPDNILLSSAPKRSLQNDKIAKEHGIQKTWHTASGESITVTDKEWEIAKAIAKKLENTETLPFKISHNVWGQEYPELHHSFIVMKNGDTFRVGAIARARPYRNMQGDTITEGVLGYGKSGVVKTILWEDGSSDVVKIDAKTHKEDPLKALEKLGKLIGEFSRNRAEKTPWLRGKEGVIQSIQDKHYTILKKENGQNLRAILKNNNFDLIQKQALALEMAKAVQSVHAQDVIHGDIHPGNILVDTHLSNAMSLIDFDRAISLTSGENHRVFGQAKGSRSYMAPEIGIWRPRWKQEGDRWVKAGGYWQFQGGDYSKASDIFALGVVMERDLGLGALGTNWQSFIKRMKSTNPVQRPTAQEMFEFIKDPSHDLNEQNAAQGRARPDPEKREIITPGQALLLLIAKYRSSDTVLAEKLKSLYLTGIRTKDENEFVEKMIEDPVLKKYQISSDPRLIANDASRRYFETHLSLETMKTRLSQLPLPLLKAHYDSIKAQFESLGGDCDQERFLQTGEKVLVRDYETEHNLRIQEGKDPEDIIKGVSAKAQAQLDKIFSGKYQESDDDMTKEYADLVSRIKNNKRLSNEEKEKGLLIIKSTRLGMVLSKNIQKYKKLGCYQGEDLPLEDIYHSNLYQEENRGRLAKDDTNRLAANHHNMGLLKGYHPLPVTDEAYSEEAYRYYKPADRSTFIDGSPWVEEGMAQKVHSYANSISGTMLVQLRTMLKLHQEGKLVLKNKEQFNNTLSAMMGIMVGISGGHSLLEFSAPIKIDKFQEGFSGIDGFDQIDLKTLFFENNETAFEAALAKTIDYNAME
ncbi:MAG TPA: protein kinase, partial [Gammaproteobacteria bacterium]|nr:protein kinase [Gammaproteobacteria bacterium]